MTKTEIYNAYKAIGKIEDLLKNADLLLESIPTEVQDAILSQHTYNATLQYCLRWGSQAATEIREDWANVMSGIEVDQENPT